MKLSIILGSFLSITSCAYGPPVKSFHIETESVEYERILYIGHNTDPKSTTPTYAFAAVGEELIEEFFEKNIQVIDKNNQKGFVQINDIGSFDYDNDGIDEPIKVGFVTDQLGLLAVGDINDYRNNTLLFTHSFFYRQHNVEMTDITGDGVPEIVVKLVEKDNKDVGVEIFEWRWPRFESVFRNERYNCF